MKPIALVTDEDSLPVDYDMDLLIEECRRLDLPVQVCRWDDPHVRWEQYGRVLLRSPWTYSLRLDEFRQWCRRVASVTKLENPLEVVEWGLDKHYLADLAGSGVPIVPSVFVEKSEHDVFHAIEVFLDRHASADEFVAKPTVGAYSRDVRRFDRRKVAEAAEHVHALHASGCAAILQPYLSSIDAHGETDLIFFNGSFSHAIRKGALLMSDGTVNAPTSEFRTERTPEVEELRIAQSALAATSRELRLTQPLLYARVDLVRDAGGKSVLLELEISEPSLSLPFCKGSAQRFAEAIASTEPDNNPQRHAAQRRGPSRRECRL